MTRRPMTWNTHWDMETTDASPSQAEATPLANTPPTHPAPIVEQLRTAQPRKKRVRDRSWEKAHPKKGYRKVPNEIRDAVKVIADDQGYSTNQIAQAFLEYALMCYQRGDFTLELELDPRYGLTLMPGGWNAEKKPIWAENLWGEKPPRKRRRSTAKAPLWKQAVYYRLPQTLIDAIERVCETRRNPDGSIASRKYHDGEVVARFLAHSIAAYHSGKLILQEPENA